jgi:carbon-monoxide dehydrogenase large subunit
VAAIVAPTTVPGYKLSEWHPLAHDKVRLVGEAIAMCVAPTRAEAEDLTEEIEVEFDELPVLVNALAARVAENIRVHEQWSDNSFLTLNLDNRFEANAKGAPVVVKRELSLNRQAMVPRELVALGTRSSSCRRLMPSRFDKADRGVATSPIASSQSRGRWPRRER